MIVYDIGMKTYFEKKDEVNIKRLTHVILIAINCYKSNLNYVVNYIFSTHNQ